jgi:eukaryotic-like serine/threonine-protein kinase
VGSPGAVRYVEFGGTERFSVVRKLGQGGMGAVYEALDRDCDLTVALKTLRRSGSDALFRLKREFRGLRELSHPNLVGLYDLFADRDPVFFSMEYVPGTDLLTYVRGDDGEAAEGADNEENTWPEQQPPLACDETKLRQVLPQVAAGLAALHEAGKLHRDIKPSNVHVTSDGVVKILDFGLAVDIESFESETTLGQVMGTVAYMSPEQAAADPRLGPAADWYAFGVMLYEALTGRLPHLGPPLQVLLKKTQDVPPPPRQLVPEVPEDLDRLAERLLVRDPETRMRGQEVLERLGVQVSVARRQRAKKASAVDLIPFQGRAAELEMLASAFEAVRDTRSAHTVVVSGPSGIGKSALVGEFVRRVNEQYPGTVVLRGRCYEWEAVSYKAMDAVIDDLSRYWRKLSEVEATRLLPRYAQLLPILFPVLGRVAAVAGATGQVLLPDPQERRTRAYAALRETFQRLTDASSAIVFIDDMQWADAESAMLLAELVRAPEAPAVLLVIGSREHGLDEGTRLRALLDELGRGARVLSVPPLSRAEGQALADLLMDSSDAQRAAAIAADAQGNPFFITELAGHKAATNPAGQEVSTVDGLVAGRAEALGSAERALLDVLAVAGEPVRQDVAAVAARLDNAGFATASRALRGGRMARVTGGREGDRIECYHDRIREALTTRLDETRSCTLHRALAEALEAAGGTPPERLAHHFAGAGQDDKAAKYAEQAAAAAERMLDFGRASALYGMALELGSHREMDQRRLVIAQADALANAGQPARAADGWQRAVSLTTDAAEALELQSRITEHLLLAGQIDRGLAAARTVAGAAGLTFPVSTLGTVATLTKDALALRVRGTRARTRATEPHAGDRLRQLDVCMALARGLGLTDPLRAFVFVQRAALRALRAGDPARSALAFAGLAVAEASLGSARYRRSAAAADGFAAEADSAVARGATAFHRVFYEYFVANNWAAAQIHIKRNRQLWREAGRGAGFEAGTMTVLEFSTMWYQGNAKPAMARLPAVIAEASRSGTRQLAAWLLSGLSPLFKLAGDDPAGALDDISAALGRWLPPNISFTLHHLYGEIRSIDAALYAGRLDAAQACLAASRVHQRRFLHLRVPYHATEYLFALARASLAAAAHDRAASVRRSQRRLALRRAGRLRTIALPLAKSYVLLLRAGAAHSTGDDDTAVKFLRAGIERLEETGTTGYAQAARRQLGVTLGGDEGAKLVNEADLWMTRRGIKRPDRFAAMILPGWTHPDASGTGQFLLGAFGKAGEGSRR